jgi:hypothetical protein
MYGKIGKYIEKNKKEENKRNNYCKKIDFSRSSVEIKGFPSKRLKGIQDKKRQFG